MCEQLPPQCVCSDNITENYIAKEPFGVKIPQFQLFVFGPGSTLFQSQAYLVRLKELKFSGKIWNLDSNDEVFLVGVLVFNPFKFVQTACNCT